MLLYSIWSGSEEPLSKFSYSICFRPSLTALDVQRQLQISIDSILQSPAYSTACMHRSSWLKFRGCATALWRHIDTGHDIDRSKVARGAYMIFIIKFSLQASTNSFDLLTLQDLNFILICYITTIISSRTEFGFIRIVQIEGSTDFKNALGGGRLGTFFLPLLLRHFLGRTLESGRRYLIFGWLGMNISLSRK